MARADVFALPSWDEAFGLVYTEAMTQGTPVIACRGEGPEDFIDDGVSGYLAPVRDAGALAGIIAEVLDDPAAAAAVGDAGSAAALALTWERNAAPHAGRLREGPAPGALKGRPMRFDRFLKPAQARHPAVVLQVSFANGLGIIRDLATPACRCWPSTPTRAPSACTRARRRHGLPRPAARTRRPSSSSSRSSAAACRSTPSSSRPTTSTSGRISRHAERLAPWYLIPFSRWETMERLYDKREQIETAWRVGVDTPKTVFVDAAADLARGADEIGFPAIFKPVESLAFKTALPPARARDRLARRAARVYDSVRDCGTLMLQEIVPGGDDELFTLGSYLDAQSRPLALFTGHKLRQHPPRFGHVPHGGEPAGCPSSPRPACACCRSSATTASARSSSSATRATAATASWRSTRATGCGTRWPPSAASTSRSPPTATPSATRSWRPARCDGLNWVVSLTDTRDAFSRWRKGDEKLIPWLKTYRGVTHDGVLSLKDPVPGALLRRAQLRTMVTRKGRPHEGEAP